MFQVVNTVSMTPAIFLNPSKKQQKSEFFRVFSVFFLKISKFRTYDWRIDFSETFFWEGWFFTSYFENTHSQRHLVANTPNSVTYLPSTKAKKANESVFSSNSEIFFDESETTHLLLHC